MPLHVFAQDALHSIVVETKRAANLLLGHESLVFDQVADSTDISWITRPSGPRQISKLSAPVREVCCSVLDSPECGGIHAIDSLEFGEDCLVRSTVAPEDMNRGTHLEVQSRRFRPRSFLFDGSVILLKRFLVLALQQEIFKDGVLHTGTFSAHAGRWFIADGIGERTHRAPVHEFHTQI